MTIWRIFSVILYISLMFVLVSVGNSLHLPGLVSKSGISKPLKPVTDLRNENRQLCEESGLPQFNYSSIDVVVVMASPVCVTQQTVKLLRFNFNFRNIYYIVKYAEFCSYLESIDEKVICLDENSVVPGLSYQALLASGVSDEIVKHQGISNRIGWYLQQYLKLGVALHLPELSDHYLVWDADNIPIKPFEMFGDNRNTVRFCANPSSKKAVGYGKFYTALTGLELKHPMQGRNIYNFVCGYMMFYKPYVKEMLDHFEKFLSKSTQIHFNDKDLDKGRDGGVREETYTHNEFLALLDDESATSLDNMVHDEEAGDLFPFSDVQDPEEDESGDETEEWSSGTDEREEVGNTADAKVHDSTSITNLLEKKDSANNQDEAEDENIERLSTEEGKTVSSLKKNIEEDETATALAERQGEVMEIEAELENARQRLKLADEDEEVEGNKLVKERVADLEAQLKLAERTQEEIEIDEEVTRITKELQAAKAEGGNDERIYELKAQLVLAEQNAQDMESEDDVKKIEAELGEMEETLKKNPEATVDGTSVKERVEELKVQLSLARLAVNGTEDEAGGEELEEGESTFSSPGSYEKGRGGESSNISIEDAVLEEGKEGEEEEAEEEGDGSSPLEAGQDEELLAEQEDGEEEEESGKVEAEVKEDEEVEGVEEETEVATTIEGAEVLEEKEDSLPFSDVGEVEEDGEEEGDDKAAIEAEAKTEIEEENQAKFDKEVNAETQAEDDGKDLGERAGGKVEAEEEDSLPFSDNGEDEEDDKGEIVEEDGDALPFADVGDPKSESGDQDDAVGDEESEAGSIEDEEEGDHGIDAEVMSEPVEIGVPEDGHSGDVRKLLLDKGTFRKNRKLHEFGKQWKRENLSGGKYMNRKLLVEEEDEGIVAEELEEEEEADQNVSLDVPLNLTSLSKGFPWNIHSLANSLISHRVFFSEYDSYGSWVMEHHPEAFELDFKITYVRNPGTTCAKCPHKAGVPVMHNNLHCCLNHKRICALGKAKSIGPHGLRSPGVGSLHHILIWEEHKLRYRTKDYCQDPLPSELAAAIEKVGTGIKPEG